MAKKEHQPPPAQPQVDQQQQQQTLTGEEYFPIGSMLKLTKPNAKIEEGEVMAFDPIKKLLILKRNPALSKKANVCDLVYFNVDMAQKIDVVSEPSEPRPVIRTSETSACQSRLAANMSKRSKMMRAFKQGISMDGINVYRAIAKTLEEIDWKEKNIVVMGKVTVTPPYKPDNVKGNAESAVAHVRKIVEKFHEEQKSNAEMATSCVAPDSGPSSPSPMNSTPPSSSSSAAGTPTTAQSAVTPVAQPVPAQTAATNNNNNNQRRGDGGSRANKNKNPKPPQPAKAMY